MASKSFRSARNTETLTTLSRLLFEALRILEMLVNSRRVSDLMSLSSIFWVLGLIGACPATKTKPPATTAWEYGPKGFGKSGEVIARLSDLEIGDPHRPPTHIARTNRNIRFALI